MKRFRQKKCFKVVTLLASLAWSGLSNAAPLINGDFSFGTIGWQGQTNSTNYPTIPGLSDNFFYVPPELILASSFDGDGTNFEVFLFQNFDLPTNAKSLTFNYFWNSDDVSDTWSAQIIDNSDPAHFATFSDLTNIGNAASGLLDLTGFGGANVQLLFSLQNIGGADDVLALSNIVVNERSSGSVPEPASLLLLGAGLWVTRRKRVNFS